MAENTLPPGFTLDPLPEDQPPPAASPSDLPPGFTLDAPVEEQPKYATDPTLTPERMGELGELTDIGEMLRGREYPVSGEMEALGLGGVERFVGVQLEDLTQAWLNATTPDPMELADILTERFPDDIEVTLSPEGVPVATNKHIRDEIQQALTAGDITEEEAASRMQEARVAINKPGFSPMDIFQTIGLIGAYSPSTRLTSMVKGLGQRIATAVLGSAATETGLQTGQAIAGGEFGEEDIAIAAALGPAAELGKPIVAGAAKIKELVKPLGEIIPKNIAQAIKFAEERGFKVTTTDALKEYITFPMQLYMKIAERIPWFGTGKISVKQQGQRADALSRMAKEFDINIETDLGQEIAESFITRMIKQRFWGKNKEPSAQQIQKAFQREGAEITDSILARYIRRGQIDEEVVDKVLDSGKQIRISEMFNKFSPSGQTAAKQRFIARGLEKAGWTPEGAQVSDPAKFLKYLDDPKNKRSIRAMFSDAEQDLLKGTREYLRLTKAAGDIKGAGMTAAMAAGAGVLLWNFATAAIGGITTGLSARAAQSATARDLFLRLVHAKGNKVATEAIMRELRPMTLAVGQQYFQGNNPIDLDVEITEDMVKGTTEEAMGFLRGQMERGAGTFEDVSTRLQEMLKSGQPNQ